jgi:Methionine gamma-lyase
VAQNFSRLSCALRAVNADHSAVTAKTVHVLDGVIANVMGMEAAVSGVQLLSGACIVAGFPGSAVPLTITWSHSGPLHPTPQVAGTHAIAVGLFSCLKPNDELLCVSGDPYDTLEEVLGVRGDAGIGNLSDWGVTSRCHYGLFTDDGGVDPSTITDSIDFGMTLITCCLHRDGNMAHVINRTPDICMQDVLVCAIFRGLVDTACGRLLQLKRFRLSSAQFVLLMTVSS